jgi:peptidoglycan hydrolase-like protein with peptidoglycan-binding domain
MTHARTSTTNRFLAMLAAVLAVAVLASVALSTATARPAAAATSGPYDFFRPTLGVGSTGVYVTEAQHRLKRLPVAAFTSPVDGRYQATTRAAVLRLQRAHRLTATGTLNRGTWTKLIDLSDPVLFAECLKRVRAICTSKKTFKTYGVINGRVVSSGAARFGRTSTPTREGVFTIYRKSLNHVSSTYGSAMPYAMFFSGGEAFHYSSDFARYGYRYPDGSWRGSHGCVNSNSRTFSAWLFRTFPVGTPVYVV